MLVMIDNYDSFTYNLVQYFGELGMETVVYRNDEITVEELERLQPSHLVISPGPCTPQEAGISIEVIKNFAEKIPILGVCLGHQSISEAFGGKTVRAKQVMHGKLSAIQHNMQGVFSSIQTPFEATRYHSLVVEQGSLPECLEVSAWTLDDKGELDEIMAVRHKELPIEGLQFHPESILTEHGHALLKNFLEN